MKKKLILYCIGYALIFFPVMNYWWASKHNFSFWDKEPLYFSIPVTFFSFLCSVGVILYQEYKNKKSV